MAGNDHKPKVGLLGLTLELYEKLAPGLRRSREEWIRRQIMPALAPLADVMFSGAVYRRQDIESAVAAYQAQGADCLLVILLTYSPSQLALPALKGTDLPILLWNTQELHAVDSSFTTAGMIDNHGVHGTQDLANVLLRSGVKFGYVTSHVRDADWSAELADFFAAAATRSRLKRAKVGLLGYPFPGMGDFAVDTTDLTARLGCQWLLLPIDEYIQGANAADAKAVPALVAEYRAAYDVADDVTDEDLSATARVELALRQMVGRRGLDALTYQFTAFGDDERTPTVPFVAASRLMAEGIGFGGEGDIVSALGTALLNWLMPPASFTEMFTIDFAGNGVFMSHMGEANVAMARKDRKVRLVARSSPITRTRGRQLCLVTAFEPGPATLCALTLGGPGDWRIISVGAKIADYGPISGMEVPHFKLVPSVNVRDFLTQYALAAGPHHCALCYGDARRRLEMLCRICGVTYHLVGETTA